MRSINASKELGGLYLIANRNGITLKIIHSMTVGENQKGELVFDSKDPEERWVTLARDGADSLIATELHPRCTLQGSAGWTTEGVGTAIKRGTLIQTARNTLFVSGDLNKGRVENVIRLVYDPAVEIEASAAEGDVPSIGSFLRPMGSNRSSAPEDAEVLEEPIQTLSAQNSAARAANDPAPITTNPLPATRVGAKPHKATPSRSYVVSQPSPPRHTEDEERPTAVSKTQVRVRQTKRQPLPSDDSDDGSSGLGSYIWGGLCMALAVVLAFGLWERQQAFQAGAEHSAREAQALFDTVLPTPTSPTVSAQQSSQSTAQDSSAAPQTSVLEPLRSQAVESPTTASPAITSQTVESPAIASQTVESPAVRTAGRGKPCAGECSAGDASGRTPSCGSSRRSTNAAADTQRAAIARRSAAPARQWIYQLAGTQRGSSHPRNPGG